MVEIRKPAQWSRRRILKLLIPLLLAGGLWGLIGSCAKPFSYLPSNSNLLTVEQDQQFVAPGDSLRVVSYNIYLSEDIDQAIADLQRNERLAAADIIVLQEMDGADTERIARTLKMNSIYWPSFKWRREKTFGNAVLSRWPISEEYVVALPHANPIMGFKRLGVGADIRVGQHQVRVVAVHLSTMAVSLENRLEQAVTLIDSLAVVEGPVILAGDFNTVTRTDRTEMTRLMRKSGFRQVRLPQGRTAHNFLDFTGMELILDHFYYRDLVAVDGGIDRKAEASDHYPIWATFTWPDSTGR